MRRQHLAVVWAVSGLGACLGLGLSVVRPFSLRDVQQLNSSFQEWDAYPPCNPLGNRGNANRTLELYFSGLAYAHPFSLSDFDQSGSWLYCFKTVIFTSAGLQEEQDLWHDDMETPGWNAGSNLQFYRRARSETLMYYMDAGATPRQAYWLEQLEDEAELNQPFSVVGGEHAYASSWIASESTRHHLGRNAVYNTSSALVVLAVRMARLLEVEYATVLWESFEVSLSAFQHTPGLDFLEAYHNTPLIVSCENAVVVLDLKLEEVAVTNGGHLRLGGLNVTLVVQGADLSEDLPQLSGFARVVPAPASLDFCTIAQSSVDTTYFAVSSVNDGLRNAEVPFYGPDLYSLVPLLFAVEKESPMCTNVCQDQLARLRQLWPGQTRAYDISRAIFRTNLTRLICNHNSWESLTFDKARPDAALILGFIDNQAMGNPVQEYELVLNNHNQEPEGWTSNWYWQSNDDLLCRLQVRPEETCKCRWPFTWNRRVYNTGECAFGGGLTEPWCLSRSVGSAAHPLYVKPADWIPCVATASAFKQVQDAEAPVPAKNASEAMSVNISSLKPTSSARTSWSALYVLLIVPFGLLLWALNRNVNSAQEDARDDSTTPLLLLAGDGTPQPERQTGLLERIQSRFVLQSDI